MTFKQDYGKSYEIIEFSETLTKEFRKNRDEMFDKDFNHQNIAERNKLFKIEAKIFEGNIINYRIKIIIKF